MVYSSIGCGGGLIMNKTSLLAAFNNPSFSSKFYLALRALVTKKTETAQVNNAKGVPCLNIRFVENKFEFTDKKGYIVPRDLVFSILRSV